MKPFTVLIHTIVSIFHLEYCCIYLGRYISGFQKAIPLPQEYPKGNFIKIKRHSIVFNVDRSDYMQWHLYADLPDTSWRKAADVVTDNCVVLDIGANCGQFSLMLGGALTKRGFNNFVIHAFEPNPKIFDLLAFNVKLNPHLEKSICCHPLALGDKTGEIGFTYSPTNSGGGAVVAMTDAQTNSQVVRIQRLDDVADSLMLSKVDFIKIDVEGFEPEVLWGAEQIIRKFHPWLYVEITPVWFSTRGHSTESILKKLTEYHYEFLAEYDDCFLPYSENELLFRSLHQFNLLAKPISNGI